MKYLILLPILLPMLSAFIIYLFNEKQRKLKNIIVFTLLVLTFAMTIVNCFIGSDPLNIINITSNLSFTFRVDNLSKLFSIAISFIWIIVSVYTFEYIKHEGSENRFYTFFFITLAMLLALCYSANLVTMYLCFEMVSLISMPLVLHSLSKESIAAAKKYLFYSIGGAFIALFGIFYLANYCDNSLFGEYGGLDCFKENNFTGNKNLFNVLIFLTIVGFATKAGMFPMHGWLPVAHPVAPSSASAVLSGVITKAGVIAIIRVVYYVVGPSFIASTWVQYAWLALACLTIFMGSLLATFEKNLKKRLAYSSVSQVSYVLASLAMPSDITFTGALLHVVAHMLIKVCLFLFAGELIYKFNYRNVDQLKGIGKIMPISTWCYTIASLGLIGIPLTVGFVSKWSIATGALACDVTLFNWLLPVILLLSAMLTAAYLLPITFNGFFNVKENYSKNEVNKLMYIPLMILASLIVLFGLFYQPIINFIGLIIGK